MIRKLSWSAAAVLAVIGASLAALCRALGVDQSSG